MKLSQPRALTHVDEDELELSLAQQNGRWMRWDSDLAVMMKAGVLIDLSPFVKPSVNVSKWYCGIESGQIHLIVTHSSRPIVNCPREDFEGLMAPRRAPVWWSRDDPDWIHYLMRPFQVYVRSSYQIIADSILDKAPSVQKYVLVTGTPGVGKSSFLPYLLWRLSQMGRRVMSKTMGRYNYFDGQAWSFCSKLPHILNRAFWTPDLWCLVDSEKPRALFGLPTSDISLVLISTVRAEIVDDFKKIRPLPEVYYMPLWSREELAAIAVLTPEASTQWTRNFNCLGGVPRLVFDVNINPLQLLDESCRAYSVTDCLKIVSNSSQATMSANVSQRLVQIDSESPYRTHTVKFASRIAYWMIVIRAWENEFGPIVSLMGARSGHRLTQTLSGSIIEAFSLIALKKVVNSVRADSHGGDKTRNSPL